MEGFYKANEYASMNPNFLCCTENALGIRDWLESQGHEYVVTDDKEVPKWPKLQNTFRIFTFSSPPHSTHLILPKKQSRRFKTYILSQQELGLVILYGWSHG